MGSRRLLLQLRRQKKTRRAFPPLYLPLGLNHF
ncbi:hypothetical protein OIU84_006223 [Salix udensis]|uniref:Uncharacterized protein n=1 Tax=Salix udensis TaxID=889485 RepID=A0AAD6P1N3_9ROSI|nr:hypothetical protein OIU84_006223 [Salix udensis]